MNCEAGKFDPRDPTVHDIEQQVERILESDQFRMPKRGRDFLRFVVAETLAGRGDYLKAFTIAQLVFGRDVTFDIQNDPCVRIEAARVRRELEHYYLVAGGSDPVIITIPKGRYVPRFEINEIEQVAGPSQKGMVDVRELVAAPPIGASREERPTHAWFHTSLAASGAVIVLVALAGWLFRPVAWSDAGVQVPLRIDSRPTVLVEPFESEDGLASTISQGVNDEILNKLAHIKEVIAVTRVRSPVEPPRFMLQGSTRLQGNNVRWFVRLVRTADGAIVWANKYEANLLTQGALETAKTFADSISAAIAGPFGAISRNDANNASGKIGALTRMECPGDRSEMAGGHEVGDLFTP